MTDDELTTKLCELAASVGAGVWRRDGPAYANPETGIYYGQIGSTAHRGIGITLYATTDADLRNELPGPRRAQFAFRGAPDIPNSANVIAQSVFDGLHGMSRVAGIFLIRRVSSAQLGVDGNRRPERADNYEIQIDLSGA